MPLPVHSIPREIARTRIFIRDFAIYKMFRDWLAEREGFEPSVPVTQYARLAIWCLRPLGHLSALPIFRAIPRTFARSSCPPVGFESTTFWQISGIFGGTNPAAASDRSTRSASLRSGLRVHRA